MRLSVPQPWSRALKQQNEFFERVASSSRSILITDYDGTLAPFQKDKMQAFPYPGLEERLSCLQSIPDVRLVLVTGRVARELKSLLRFSASTEIWGSHGREYLNAAGEYRIHPLTSKQENALDAVQAVLEQKGYVRSIERKPTSMAVHWRGESREEQRRIETLTRSLAEQHTRTEGFETIPFEAGIELRAIGRTKADAVREILQDEPADAISAYLGDDRTDEDAFPMMRGRGISVLVRHEIRESLADYWMSPPEDLINFFDHWIHSARSRSCAKTTGVW